MGRKLALVGLFALFLSLHLVVADKCSGDECIAAPFVTEGVDSGRTRSSAAEFTTKKFPNKFSSFKVLQMGLDDGLLDDTGDTFLSGQLAVTTTGEIVGSLIHYPFDSQTPETPVGYYLFAAKMNDNNKMQLLWIESMINGTLLTTNLESVNRCFTPTAMNVEGGSVQLAISCPKYATITYDHENNPESSGVFPAHIDDIYRGPNLAFTGQDVRDGGYNLDNNFARVELATGTSKRVEFDRNGIFTFSTTRAKAAPSVTEPNPDVWVSCGSMNTQTNQDEAPNAGTMDDCTNFPDSGLSLGYAPLVEKDGVFYETACLVISPEGEMGFGVGASLTPNGTTNTDVKFVVFGFDSHSIVGEATTLWEYYSDTNYTVDGQVLSVSSLDIPCPALMVANEDTESDGVQDDYILFVPFLGGKVVALSVTTGEMGVPPEKWTLDVESPFSPLLVSGDSQLLVTTPGRVYLIDTEDGKTLKRISLPSKMTATEAATPYRKNQLLVPAASGEDLPSVVLVGKFEEDDDNLVWIIVGVVVGVLVVGAVIGGIVYMVSTSKRRDYETM